MEPKVICVLLVVFSLALSAQAQGQAETCTVAPKQRANCGYPGVTPSQCAEKGCCFDSSVPGYPWCFHPVKVDNAHERISEDDCDF